MDRVQILRDRFRLVEAGIAAAKEDRNRGELSSVASWLMAAREDLSIILQRIHLDDDVLSPEVRASLLETMDKANARISREWEWLNEASEEAARREANA